MTAPVLSPNAWLRWDGIARHLDALAPVATVLELGMGQGSAGARLAEGRRYVGVEPDDRSRAVAAGRLPADARVLADLSDLEPEARFDVVCAFEVLEHIEDDRGALVQWAERVRPGGHVLLSVPAHQHRFSAADQLVGHYRRYGRQQLRDLFVDVGLEPTSIDGFGFPLGHVLEWGRNRLADRRLQQADVVDGEEARSATSGRTWQPPSWAGQVTRGATAPFRLAQRPFRHSERATGWLVLAAKPTS